MHYFFLINRYYYAPVRARKSFPPPPQGRAGSAPYSGMAPASYLYSRQADWHFQHRGVIFDLLTAAFQSG